MNPATLALLSISLLCTCSCASVRVAMRDATLPNLARRGYQDAGTTPSGQVSEDQKNTQLAKKTQNPIADLISLPFQNNTQFGVGTADRTANVLNIQPVIPTKLSEDWLLINRVIVPIVSQPGITAAESTESGLGDTVYTAFLSPQTESQWTLGFGPVLQIPTHTDDRLGNDHWGLGPSAVVVGKLDQWVLGGLVNNVWSVGGSSDPTYNQMLIQPFLNYNIGRGWYLVSAPILTANWKANGSEVWTVPFGGGGGKVFQIGKQPVNVSIQVYYNVAKPSLAGNWSSRFQVQFLF